MRAKLVVADGETMAINIPMHNAPPDLGEATFPPIPLADHRETGLVTKLNSQDLEQWPHNRNPWSRLSLVPNTQTNCVTAN